MWSISSFNHISGHRIKQELIGLFTSLPLFGGGHLILMAAGRALGPVLNKTSKFRP